MAQKIDWNYLFIGLLGALFFLPFLGGVHLFDWDEINFAEVSREMIVTGEYLRPQINYEAFWEKPPLFFWLQSLSMRIFGVNEYAARFPNAICGIITLVLLYYFGKKIYDKTFGWLWVLSYFGAFLPHLYFKSGIIDPWFNLFIFLSYIFLIENQGVNQLEKESNSKTIPLSILLAGLFSGLAILTKGPVGYLIVFLAWSIKTVIYREFSLKNVKHFTLFSIIALLTTLLWFGVETLRNGTWFVKTFIEYNLRLAKTEDAGHGGFMGYHFVIIFFGCFPASIFALRSLFSRYNFFGEKTDYTRSMKVLFWVVIILFSLVQSKIVHYSSMCYLPLTFLSAIALYDFCEKKEIPFWVKNLLLIVSFFIGSSIAAVPIVGQNIEWLHEYFKGDAFVLKILEAKVEWSANQAMVGISFIIVIFLLVFYLKKVKIWSTATSRMPSGLRGLAFLFLTTAVFLNAVLIVFINNIEGYSQNAAISFLESKASEDCYVATFDYKSYANVFYAKKRIPTNPKHTSNEWLMQGKVDKPTYWLAKYPSKSKMDTMPTLRFLYEKNGFVFYQRR